MKQWLIHIVVTAGLALGLQMILPWWSIAFAGAISGAIFHGHAVRSFVGAFLAVFALWLSLALIAIGNGAGAFATDVSHIIAPGLNGTLLAVIAGIIGGLVAGFGSLSGDFWRRALQD